MLLVTEEFDAYIIVSFVNATLVLSIGETVEEVTDSGFLGTTPTLSCSALGDDALVQVKLLSFFFFFFLSIPVSPTSGPIPTCRSYVNARLKLGFASLVCSI